MLIIFTQIINKLKSRVTLTAWTAATLVCALTGPFGTYDLDTFSDRLIFWGVLIFIGIAYCLLCLHFMFYTFPNLRPLYSKLVAISFFTVTFTNAIYMVVGMFYLFSHYPPISQVYALVGAISFSVSAAIYWLHIKPVEQRKKAQEAFQYPPTLTVNSLTTSERDNILLSKFDTDTEVHLIRLTMRDHYVEIFSNQGSQLIHMRFSEAIDTLSDFNGMQIHRSHWVNFDEVIDIIKSKGKILFKMSDGAQVPISRLKQKELKEIGML